jgi:hypothetical protein
MSVPAPPRVARPVMYHLWDQITVIHGRWLARTRGPVAPALGVALATAPSADQ